ncbi:MAG: cation-translocating P-type ATPase [Anaerovoracaceae bacterium]
MWEQRTIEETLAELKIRRDLGLSKEEAKARLDIYGPNRIVEKKPKTKIMMFLGQLKDPMIYILFVAVAISLALREVADSIIILAIILFNAIIGAVQEAKAQRSLMALKELASPIAAVKRDGQIMEVPAAQLVPGDVVIIEAGRIVPADLRIIASANLKIEESALTGEAVPSEKDAGFVAQDGVGLGDRHNMAYLSTSVAYGRGEGVVVGTGMDTEIGKIAEMINTASESLTPLQKRLGGLGRILGVVAIALCAALFAVALFQGRDVPEMLLTAISLTVAVIPEGLPMVITIVLALGVTRMVRANTIVRKLPAVETLGSVSVVCSDKTGTLTQNKMTVVRIYYNGELREFEEWGRNSQEEERKTFMTGWLLCNDSIVSQEGRIGDPTETALVDMGASLGMDREEISGRLPRINEKPFDSERKMMTTVHEDDRGRIVAYTKGAMDQIIERCTKIQKGTENYLMGEKDVNNIKEAARVMAGDALRVLAIAVKEGDNTAGEEELTFIGMVGMIDPPRREAAEAVRIFKNAGVMTVMITGDHKDTAFAIARELGIADELSQCISGAELSLMTQEELNLIVPKIRVFARVSPEHKVMIVKAFKSHGHIVSMTGDGVNDAPSLKIADIGVAMGITGTDVAKEASDMILTDDNFATIEVAIEEGRNIYNNIRKSVFFLLSSNLGEILTMFAAILAGLASPLKAIHILWVNLITDSLPGLALGVDKGDPEIMKEKPRNPQEGLFAGGGLFAIFYFGSVIAVTSLLAFLIPPFLYLMDLGMSFSLNGIKVAFDDEMIHLRGQTYAFTVLAMSQLCNAAGMRNLSKSFFKIPHLDNKIMVLAFCAGLGLQIAVTEIPFLTEAFGIVSLSLKEWIGLGLLSTLPIWFHELVVLIRIIKKDDNDDESYDEKGK